MNQWQKLFPYWEDLTSNEKNLLQEKSVYKRYEKNILLHRSEQGCTGIMFVLSGELRTYIVSEEGREITLFRVNKDEVCVLSATCLMDSIVFDMVIDAMEDTEVVIIPVSTMQPILQKYPKIEVWLYKTATERFSEVMWTMQQLLFMGIDKRVAIFLWDEMIRNDSTLIQLKHEEIAKYIGSAREVVSKILKYFAQEGILRLGRGKIEVLNKEKLKKCI